MKTKITVTRLGRLDGNVVLPKSGIELLLSTDDKDDLKAALSAAAAEPAPAPAPAAEPGLVPTPVPPKPKKREKFNEYYEQNKEAIINDYYLLPRLELFSKWSLCSTVWMKLQKRWKVAPKGPVHRFTGRKITKHEPPSESVSKVTTGSNGALPDFPAFNDSWPPQVKIEWFKTYKELRAIGEK